ncbi:hypothetical protein [Saccharibacillus sp. JS10]|uniref:hypothetical protein n=1 Tax=Saccharibacillus sp. JS10 TaxID=2950552 RepID=UPI00210EC082|nr:hypothetical protein [Saccharibacillus sp. JS10]MCQ4088377.1 hypothetical protein [Saccharibacillus sp. JS10]
MNHMTMLGFQMQEEDDFLELANTVYERGNLIRTAKGAYVRFEAGGGAELWLQLNAEGVAIGMQPHFTGAGLMRIGIEAEVMREEGSELDGTFYAWAEPENAGEKLYSFVFDLPDRDHYGPLTQPMLQYVQLAAFAHDINVFANEVEYEHYQLSQSLVAPIIPAQSFLSTGLNDDGGEDISTAKFSGTVLRAGWIKNELTGRYFQWALVRTYGGDIDVVADETLIEGREIHEGDVLNGTFWLSGRLVEAPQ